MGQEPTSVNIMTLEEFHQRLSARLATAEAVAAQISRLAQETPRLGTFADAVRADGAYRELCATEINRVERLITAVRASRDATAEILDNYRTAEDRNGVDAESIARHLDPYLPAETMTGTAAPTQPSTSLQNTSGWENYA